VTVQQLGDLAFSKHLDPGLYFRIDFRSIGAHSLGKAQHKAVANFRKRLKQKRMARLEVHVRKDDAALVRNVIRALANPDQEQATRALLREYFGTGQAQGLKALLTAAPLEGIELRRARAFGRKVDL
jgi:hypothetical protein